MIELREKSGINGKVRAILKNKDSREIVYDSGWKNNTITNAALNSFARASLNIGSKSNEGQITYGAVGTGTGIISINDTTLEDEVARSEILVKSVSNGEITTEVYFDSSQANGETLSRYALFGEDATSSADSGTMFNHLEFDEPFSKTSQLVLTIQTIITFS